MTTTVDIVVPTIGRPTLFALVRALAAQRAPLGGRLVIVDDRKDPEPALEARLLHEAGALDVIVLRAGRRGPAAARNVGWRRATARWVGFLDDDVRPGPGWSEALAHDLERADAEADVVAVQGRIVVPLPTDRRATDWERNVAGLERARWATADMAVRRDALAAVNGFDEAFPRAYREDADLAVRLRAIGGRLVDGSRFVEHPVRPAPWHVSVGLQAGNADDATMRRRHGRRWRDLADVPRGAFGRHVATTAALIVSTAVAAAGRHRSAAAIAATWLAGTASFAVRRIAPGPRTPAEIAAMVATSFVIPPAAVAHRVRGELRARRLRAVEAPASTRRVDAVLFDRDGTLVLDVPYNGDPARVVPAAGAASALDALRRAGVQIGIISNQSGVARGVLDLADVDAVNRRVAELLGPFATVEVCPHGPDDGCGCRKPRPGLVHRAAAALGVEPAACAVVGDIGADVDAAVAAGARAVLVPTPATRSEEIAAAAADRSGLVAVAGDLAGACLHVLERWQ